MVDEQDWDWSGEAEISSSYWTSNVFDISTNTDTDYIIAGTVSMKITNATAQTGFIISEKSYGNISSYVGVSSGQTTEGVIGIWIYIATGTDLNSIKLRIGSSSSDYVEATGELLTGFENNGWNYIVFKLKTIAPTGTPNWTDIDFIRFEIDVGASNFYLNYLTVGDGDTIAINGLGKRSIERVVI